MRGVWEGCEMKTSRRKGEIIFGGVFFFFGNKKIGFPKPPVVGTFGVPNLERGFFGS